MDLFIEKYLILPSGELYPNPVSVLADRSYHGRIFQSRRADNAFRIRRETAHTLWTEDYLPRPGDYVSYLLEASDGP